MKKQFKEPEFARVKFMHVQKEINAANATGEDKIQLIIASCPSRIGDDDQIMQKMTEMIGSSKAVSKCFSYYGNAASIIDECRQSNASSSKYLAPPGASLARRTNT